MAQGFRLLFLWQTNNNFSASSGSVWRKPKGRKQGMTRRRKNSWWQGTAQAAAWWYSMKQVPCCCKHMGLIYMYMKNWRDFCWDLKFQSKISYVPSFNCKMMDYHGLSISSVNLVYQVCWKRLVVGIRNAFVSTPRCPVIYPHLLRAVGCSLQNGIQHLGLQTLWHQNN